MAYNSKLHKKLKNEKKATVSLDSLLGLLSSAYGTEEIDSNVLFEKDTINWRNLSVESFKSAPKKQGKQGNKEETLNKKDFDKSNAATSTTSLKPYKNSNSEVDITLVSIKSLNSFKQAGCTFELDTEKVNKTLLEESDQDIENGIKPESATVSNSLEKEPVEGGMEDQKGIGDSLECRSVRDEPRELVCSFYVDNADHKVFFDIEFVKKLDQNEIMPSLDIGEPEIIINVTDISKQTKSHIKVDKFHLVSKVQYFADVDKEFGLLNLDVNVMCNLSVFNWIVQWIKADMPMCKPNLNTNNLKCVLLMARHLKITDLIDECLHYLHMNCKTVLETDWEIEEVFDDNLFLQLVSLFSSIEIDAINDYFESFKESMYCSLIRLLADPTPCFQISHFSTLSTIFQCALCEKQFHYNMVTSIPCRNDCNQLDFEGALVPYHEPLASWDLSKFIELLFDELGNWKIVYWKLWGKCHFLKCCNCKQFFPLGQNDWCLHHPEEVEYFPLNSSGDTHPIGMYKCCGKVAFRYNVLEPKGGCKYQIHKPELKCEAEIETYKAFQYFKHFICDQPPENNAPKKFIKLMKKPEGEFLKSVINPEHFWWSGIRLAPKDRKDYSVIPQEVLNRLRDKHQEVKPEPKCASLCIIPPVHMGTMPLSTSDLEQDKFTNEMPSMSKMKKMKPKVKKAKPTNLSSPGRVRNKKKKFSFTYQPTECFWVNTKPVEDNQDIQRDFEEIAMRNLVTILTPEDCSGSICDPIAGSYARLESEWCQRNCGDPKVPGSSKNYGTVVNRTYPLCWFRRLTI